MISKTDQFQQFEHFIDQHTVIKDKAQVCYRQYYHLFLFRRLAEFLLTAVFVYVGMNFLILSHFNLPLWPATGVALTVVFLRGNYPYLGIALGAIGAFYINCQYVWFSLLQGIVFTLYIYLLRFSLLRWVGAIQPLSHYRILFYFIVLCAAFTFAHVISLYFITHLFELPWPFKQTDVYMHCLAELNGILCLTPLTLSFNPFTPKKYFSFKPRNIAWCTCMLLMIGAHLGFFWLRDPMTIALLMLTVFVCICGFAMMFKLIPTTCLLLGMGLLYLGGLTDFTKEFFNAYITGTYLTVLCVVSLGLAVYQPQNKSVHVDLTRSASDR